MTEESNLLFLWGPPRSLSTAFLRMMIERGDHEVIHEPFSSITVQGQVTIGERTATSHDELLKLLAERACDKRVFVKETTEYDYLGNGGERIGEIGLHTFIIRHPRSVIPSHYAMNPKMTCAEVGYQHQVELARQAWEGTDSRPVVVEAEDLVANPVDTVADYCAQVGIPFLESALSWKPRDHQAWSRTKEWHQDAATSSCFSQPRRTYAQNVDNTPLLTAYYEHHLPYYEFLRAWAREPRVRLR
jgi:hypothetical protein